MHPSDLPELYQNLETSDLERCLSQLEAFVDSDAYKLLFVEDHKQAKLNAFQGITMTPDNMLSLITREQLIGATVNLDATLEWFPARISEIRTILKPNETV